MSSRNALRGVVRELVVPRLTRHDCRADKTGKVVVTIHTTILKKASLMLLAFAALCAVGTGIGTGGATEWHDSSDPNDCHPLAYWQEIVDAGTLPDNFTQGLKRCEEPAQPVVTAAPAFFADHGGDTPRHYDHARQEYSACEIEGLGGDDSPWVRIYDFHAEAYEDACFFSWDRWDAARLAEAIAEIRASSTWLFTLDYPILVLVRDHLGDLMPDAHAEFGGVYGDTFERSVLVTALDAADDGEESDAPAS